MNEGRRPGRPGGVGAARGALRAPLVLGLAATMAVSSLHPARADRVRIDGIVAVVGATSPRSGAVVVLVSDVELEAWLARARDGTPVDASSPPLTTDEMQAARERCIGRALLVWEAARLRLDEVDEARLGAEWRRFFERHGGARAVEAVVARLRLGNDELERSVRADAVARAFVLASAEQGGLVTDAELEEAWEAGDHPYVGMDLETMREAFRTTLLEERVRIETQRWVERLRLRVPMRRSTPAR